MEKEIQVGDWGVAWPRLWSFCFPKSYSTGLFKRTRSPCPWFGGSWQITGFKIDSWNFQNLFGLSFHETSQNFCQTIYIFIFSKGGPFAKIQKNLSWTFLLELYTQICTPQPKSCYLGVGHKTAFIFCSLWKCFFLSSREQLHSTGWYIRGYCSSSIFVTAFLLLFFLVKLHKFKRSFLYYYLQQWLPASCLNSVSRKYGTKGNSRLES